MVSDAASRSSSLAPPVRNALRRVYGESGRRYSAYVHKLQSTQGQLCAQADARMTSPSPNAPPQPVLSPLSGLPLSATDVASSLPPCEVESDPTSLAVSRPGVDGQGALCGDEQDPSAAGELVPSAVLLVGRQSSGKSRLFQAIVSTSDSGVQTPATNVADSSCGTRDAAASLPAVHPPQTVTWRGSAPLLLVDTPGWRAGGLLHPMEQVLQLLMDAVRRCVTLAALLLVVDGSDRDEVRQTVRALTVWRTLLPSQLFARIALVFTHSHALPEHLSTDEEQQLRQLLHAVFHCDNRPYPPIQTEQPSSDALHSRLLWGWTCVQVDLFVSFAQHFPPLHTALLPVIAKACGIQLTAQLVAAKMFALMSELHGLLSVEETKAGHGAAGDECAGGAADAASKRASRQLCMASSRGEVMEETGFDLLSTRLADLTLHEEDPLLSVWTALLSIHLRGMRRCVHRLRRLCDDEGDEVGNRQQVNPHPVADGSE